MAGPDSFCGGTENFLETSKPSCGVSRVGGTLGALGNNAGQTTK